MGHIRSNRTCHGRLGALFIEADVIRESDDQQVMERAAERFGRIHAAVNNAGSEGRFGLVRDATVEDFDRIIGVNLKGVGWPRRETSDWGWCTQGIVNSADNAGHIAAVVDLLTGKHRQTNE